MQDLFSDRLDRRIDIACLHIARDAQVHGRTLAVEHALDGAAQLVAEQADVGDGVGFGRHRRHDQAVVEGARSGVLEQPHALHIVGNLAGEGQHRRLVGIRGRERGDRIGQSGPADAQTHAKLAAGAGVSVGHVGRPTLLRRDDGRHLRHAAERREKGIDQTARHHEHVVDTVSHQ